MTGRVAVALNLLAPYWHEVFDALAQKGWIVRVFEATETEKNRMYKVADFSKHGFTVKRNRSISIDLSHTGTRTSVLHFQWGLYPDLVRFRPDVILSNQVTVRTLIALAYGKVHSVPVIPWMAVSPHTERNNSKFRERYRAAILRRSRCVCTNLTEGKRYLVERVGLREDRLFCVPYAVNAQRYREAADTQRPQREATRQELGLDGFTLLYVGQMIPRKGIQEMANALATLDVAESARLSLLLIGGKLSPALEHAFASTGVKYRCLPFVQPEDLIRYYAAVDAFVLPTLSDEWGIVLNEAIAAGLPVIASPYAGATTDLVQNGVNGVIADPHDPVGFANAIVSVSRLSREQLLEWREGSLQIAGQHDIKFTIDKMHEALQRAMAPDMERVSYKQKTVSIA
jgi:glycosyltransferase involved in cell wall biosynthesis